MLSVNVGTTTPAAQLVSAGQGTTLIANNDPAFTLWIGDSYAISANSGISTPSIPLSAGSSLVVDGKTDVFAIADPSATNAIQAIVIQGGLSFFQPFTELIVQGSTARVLIYAGLAALGTLIGSWAAVAGKDIFGNTYPAGLNVVTQALINNASIVNAAIANAVINGSTLNQGSVFESTVTFDTVGGGLFMYSTTTTTITLAANTTSWTAPAGTYTSGYVKVWAGGGSGDGGGLPGSPIGAYAGQGAGGGGYAENSTYPLTPGTVYTTVVSPGGNGVATGSIGNSATASTFDFTTLTGPSVRASGGDASNAPPSGGIGGFPVVGTVGFQGGNGGANSLHSSSLSGGGGAAGGPGGQGGNGGQNGPAGISHGGGNGGAGVASNTNGQRGAIPGGGGGGAGFSTGAGLTSGAGGDGRITITLNTATVVLAGVASPVAGTDASGNAFAAGFTGQITAWQPGSIPQALETWHTATLDSGWSGGNGIIYRATSENTVKVFGSSLHAAFTGGTNMTSSNPLPVAYRPAKTWNIGGPGFPNRAGAEITAAGIIVAEPNGVSCTECDIAGEYPLGV